MGILLCRSIRPNLRNFFFSSRRRHTRLVSDWSLDVCSSDLARIARLASLATLHFKDAEIPQLDTSLRQQGLNDCVEGLLHDLLGLELGQTERFRDLLDKIGRASCRERVSVSGEGG